MVENRKKKKKIENLHLFVNARESDTDVYEEII